VAYTKEFFKLIMAIINISILRENPIIDMLNVTSLSYFTTMKVSTIVQT